MDLKDLEVVDGISAGSWIRRRLADDFGSVRATVPEGFESYARVLHPALDRDLRPIRWATVAASAGKTAHREMQWHSITGAFDPVRDPSLGEMDRDELEILCEIIAGQTLDAGDCLFGFCEIMAWPDEVFPPRQRTQPLLELPFERRYVVLQGPLTAAGRIGEPPMMGAPNLIWPPGRSWLVASEVDFDSTLVGGDADLVEAIVGSPRLEAWRVEPTDSLAADADRVNGGAGG